MLTYLLIPIGFALLFFGGDGLVRGAVGFARRFGVSPMMIGATVVAYGTTTPELFVSVEAALAGSPGISIGNVVGSNICNFLLILGQSPLNVVRLGMIEADRNTQSEHLGTIRTTPAIKIGG